MRELRRIILLTLAGFAIATVFAQGKTNLVQANHARVSNGTSAVVTLGQPSTKSDCLYVFVAGKGQIAVTSSAAKLRLVQAKGIYREFYGTITDATQAVSVVVTGGKPSTMEIQLIEVTK